jgi:hypothetical protein
MGRAGLTACSATHGGGHPMNAVLATGTALTQARGTGPIARSRTSCGRAAAKRSSRGTTSQPMPGSSSRSTPPGSDRRWAGRACGRTPASLRRRPTRSRPRRLPDTLPMPIRSRPRTTGERSPRPSDGAGRGPMATAGHGPSGAVGGSGLHRMPRSGRFCPCPTWAPGPPAVRAAPVREAGRRALPSSPPNQDLYSVEGVAE